MTTSVVQDGNTPPDGATAPKLTSKDRRRVAFASTIGTTIEFYDFYIYATAAVAVFPLLFFPATEDPTVALLQSFATFGLAFVARPWAQSSLATSATASAARQPWWAHC